MPILLSLFHDTGVRLTVATEPRADGNGEDATIRVVRDGAAHGTTIKGSRAPLANVVEVIEDIRRRYPESDGWLE